MQVVLPEQALPAKLALNLELRMNDDDYYALCVANPDVRLERNAEGEIILAPPAGMESDYQRAEVIGQLREWARRDGRGKAFGSSVEFILPTGAAFSPDAAWVSHIRLASISKEQRRKFPPLAPEFVVEVLSLSDRLPVAQKKMEEWRRGGVELAWLIHPEAQSVYVYRPGQAVPELYVGITKLTGEGPVAGFELELTSIRAGL